MDRIIERIIEILTANVKTPRGIKVIFDGDPWLIPKVSIPAILVRGTLTTPATVTNCQDQDTHSIEITLVLSAKDYWNTSNTEFTGDKIARKIFEEREDDNSHKLKSDTILHAIRSVFDADANYTLQSKNVNINYEVYRDRAGFDDPTLEPTMTLECASKPYLR
jgi:hypothetical protein